MKNLLMKVCLVFAMTASTWIVSDLHATCSGNWLICESDREEAVADVAANCEDFSDFSITYIDCYDH